MSAPAATSGLNDGQRAALDLSRDLLVSAGAGAGKTQVLGFRFLGLLEEGFAAVPEIVAFTFTEKAAAEMRQRVLERLLERIAELPKGERLDRLRRAQAEFAANRITTIHGFCHRVLRDYAWEAGLEPGAPILDPRDQALARERAVKRVLLQTDANDQPELAAALVRLGSVVRLFSLTGTLLGMLADRAAVGPPLRRAAELWAEPATEVARRRAQYEALLGEHLQGVLDAVNKINFAAAAGANAGDNLRDKLAELRAAADARDGAALRDCLLTKSGDVRKPVGAKGGWKHDPAAFEDIREKMQQAAHALLPIVDVLAYKFDEAFERRVGGVARDLAIVFEAVCAAYVDECAGALDFLDLELKTLDLLRHNAEARAEIVRGAKYLLVDEYQDTNPTQDELFQLLTTEQDAPGRFFAVGDSKQSIYAFRGSDVRVFNRALEWIPRRNQASGATDKPLALPWGLRCEEQLPDAKAAKKDTSRQAVESIAAERQSGIVRLEHNYRTVKPVLELGNAVFRRVFARDEFRDFDARPQDMLHGGAAGDAETPPVLFHALDAATAIEEAEYVAQQVLELRDWKVPLSDIAILVRRGTRNANYRAAFARLGLPLLVIGEGGLFETQEALDCVNLLRALSNENDDIAVLGLLRSPFAGLSDRFLTELSLGGNRSDPLLKRLRAWPQNPPQATTFLQRFNQLRERAGRDAPALLLTEALSACGYPLAVGCGPDAEQRLANVARVVELIREMQQGLPSLAPLVRELRERIERGEDEVQGAPDSTAEGVRLMTIHKSKGLEFPVVILPDLSANVGGNNSGMVRDLPEGEEPLGLYLKSLDDDDRGDSRGCFAAWRAKLANREREAAEEKRVLYVAYTRAAQRLICITSLKAGKPFDKETWAHQLLRALGVNDWRQPSPHSALALHWVDKVEMTEPIPHTAAIEAMQQALADGALSIVVDDALVAPIAATAEPTRAGDPDAMEFGTLVHAGLERLLRVPSSAGPEGAAQSPEAHVRRAAEALATLPPARRELPEFGVMTAGGARRFDLLRDLGQGRYQIIDYKTDLFDGDPQTYAEAEHGEQLRGYARALQDYLQSRGQAAAEIGLFVCFTAQDSLQPDQRLVEITPG